jgi:hypothetical protein
MNPHIRSPRPARPAPRPLLAFALALAVAFAAGCGDKTLILRVDLLSFLTPEEQDAHYGPVPAGITDSVEVVRSRQLNLLPGLEDVASVTDVQLEVGAIIDNLTGAGRGRIGVYLSPGGTDPFVADTTPIEGTFEVDGAMSDTIQTVHVGDTDLAELFTSKEAQIGIRLVLESTAGGPPLEGDIRITTLRAVVTAKEAVFE